MPYHSVLPDIPRFLIRRLEPRGENVIYHYLVRRSRKHLHGLRGTTLLFMCALAIFSARVLATHTFSFNIWLVLFYAYLLLPAIMLERRLRTTPDGLHLLMLPLGSSDYIRAIARFFLLVTIYCAIPFVFFWCSFFLMRSRYYPNWFVHHDPRLVVFGPLMHAFFLVFTAWVFYWCSILGRWHLVLFALYVAALLVGDEFDEMFIYMQLLPAPGFLFGSLAGVYILVYLAVGIMYLRRNYVARILHRF